MISPDAVLLHTDLAPVPLYIRGKVRDVYDLGGRLLFIATDRISAFDYVLGSGIPYKGHVLNQLSLFWFEFLREIVPNHLITANVEEYPSAVAPHRDQLRGRSMLVLKAEMVPVECVVRGYLAGSGWKDYQATGAVCGIKLPRGLKENEKLPEPVFTPAIKASSGHDENITFADMVKRAGPRVSEDLRERSLKIYKAASEYAQQRGILLADTKFEFGVTPRGIVLGDEVMTPDSSRFWPKEEYEPGRPQHSFDKQFVRDYLESIGWNKQPPAPSLPAEIAKRTSDKYVEAFTKLTGRELQF